MSMYLTILLILEREIRATFYIVVCMLSTVGAVQSQLNICPDGWTRFHSSCYLFNDNIHLNWVDASHHCALHHSTLVTIESKEEDAFLRDFLNRLFRDNKEHAIFWTRGSDTVIEGVWTWYTDDSSIGYSNWQPGQPDDHLNQDCLNLVGDYGFRWNDGFCTGHLFSICEKRMSGNPEIVG